MAMISALDNSLGSGSGIRPYRVSKSLLLWSCAVCVAVSIAAGFTWGGWVTGAMAQKMADRASIDGQARLAATICVDRFLTGPDARAQTALLVSAEPWRQSDLIGQEGWLTLPGRVEPVAGAAELCVQQILHSSGH